MVFIRLPSAASRKTLTEAPSSDQSTPTHTVALVPAGASFLRWVAPPSDAERKQAAAATSLLDGEDYSDYGPIGTTGKTGRTFTRDVTVKKDGTKAKKAKVEDEIDYYAVLGLSKWGTDSNQKQIKTAYHRAILLYHPDKQVADPNRPADAGKPEEDPVFLAIQKGYGILTDETKRRGYDSTFDFDEEIPSGHEKGDFFKVYGPVFQRNSRFSEKKPVPQLGNADSPMEGAWGVTAFYDFWFKFESWREFSSLDEHNANEAEDREERRWMEKGNKSARAKRKKEDMQRLRTLVEKARSKDPRVKAYTIKLRLENEAAKEAKKKAREEYKAGLLNAEKAKEDAILAEKKAKEDEKKAKLKNVAATKKLFKKLRRKWTKFCESLDVDDDNVEEVVQALGLEDGAAELQRLQQENATAEQLQEVLSSAVSGADEMKKKREEAKKVEFERIRSAKAEEQKKSVVPWTQEELSMLIKATKKYPGGSQRRWFMIGEMVNTLGLTSTRTREECIHKAKEITAQQTNAIKEKMAAETMKNFEAEVARKAKKSVKKDGAAASLLGEQAKKAEELRQQEAAAAAAAAVIEATPVVWKPAELRCLERSLVTFKKGSSRWESIAENLQVEVESTKTPQQCKEKFKSLRAEAAELKAKGGGGTVADGGKRGKKEEPARLSSKEKKGKKGKKGKKKKEEESKKEEPVVVEEPVVEEEPAAAAAATPAAPAAPVVERVALVWSTKEQRALEKALKTYPVSMEKKERWASISKAVNNVGVGGKSARKCMSRFKDLRAEAQRTAGMGKMKGDAANNPDWKKKKAAEAAKAKGYHTTTQDPDQRKKDKMKKDDEKKNKFKEGAKTQGTGKKKKKGGK